MVGCNSLADSPTRDLIQRPAVHAQREASLRGVCGAGKSSRCREFPGIRTRAQPASHIEGVVSNGQMRNLGNGRTGFWQEGTAVIRNPRASDGGNAFQPKDGYDYFLNQLH